MRCSQPAATVVLSSRRRVVLYLVGILEAMLFAGTIFGWPQLVYILKVDGIYEELCMVPPPQPSPSSLPGHHLRTDGNGSYLRAGETGNYTHQIVGANWTSLLQEGKEAPVPPLQAFNNSRCQGLESSHHASSGHTVGVEECEAQDRRLALIFTVAILCYGLPSALVGYMLHHAGLRITRIMGGAMMALGFIFMSVTTKAEPNWLFPAMILMALGGNQLRLSGMQLGDLFPEHRSTAITLLSGMFTASAAVFLMYQYAEQRGVSHAYLCWGMTGLSCLSILASFFMPRHHVPIIETGSQQPQVSVEPLRTSLWSLSSALHQLWFTVCLLAVNVYQMSFNIWVNRMSCSVEEAGMYSKLYGYSNLLCVFMAPVGGVFTDRMVARVTAKSNSVYKKRMGEMRASFWPLTVSTLSTALSSGCLLFLHPAALYISLVALIVSRPCTVAVSTAYIRLRFPGAHFDRLLGIYTTVTSAVLFLQFPHFIWAQHMYYAAHATMVALVMLSFVNPLHLLFPPFLRHTIPTDRDN